ncbi:MAG TPA: hypothetical protein VK666_17725 [Chryseolinea sp.]|nr:hypothetical protein [Chryseolinea sp.]
MAKVPISVQYVKDVFEVEDIEKVWALLKEKFHFNVNAWKKEFEHELRTAPRFTSTQEVFMIFGKKRIEPILNEVLKRQRYPTWINLLSFVLKDKINLCKQRDNTYKERFGKTFKGIQP